MTVKASFASDTALLHPPTDDEEGWVTLPRYDASRFFGVPLVLVDSVRTGIDEDGDRVTSYPDFPGLNLTLAIALLGRPVRWSGGALRHVRTLADLTGSQLAACSQHADKTVISRWEKGRARIGVQSEMALRHCLRDALAEEHPEAPLPDLKGLRLTEDGVDQPILMTYDRPSTETATGGWRVLPD